MAALLILEGSVQSQEVPQHRPAPKVAIPGNQKPISALVVSPDGQSLISVGNEIVRLWEFKTGKLKSFLKEHDGYVYFTSFTPDGKRFATSSYDTIIVSESATAQQINTVRDKGVAITGLSVGEKFIAIGGIRGTVRLFDAVTWKAITELNDEPDAPRSIKALGLTKNDTRLLVAHSSDVCIWDVQTKKLYARFDVDNKTPNPVTSAAISEDGKIAISAGWAGVVNVYDVDNKKVAAEFMVGDYIYSVALSRDGRTVAAGCRDGWIFAWDLQRRQLLLKVRPSKTGVTAMTFSPDGKTLVTGDEDGAINVWDCPTLPAPPQP